VIKNLISGGEDESAYFKDVKTITGFLSAVILCIMGILLAAGDQEFWVVPVVIAFILLSYSIRRADKYYRN
jgi:hypothetical protein